MKAGTGLRKGSVVGLILVVLSGCQGIPRADYAPVPAMPVDARPSPLMLSNIKYRLPTGTEIGTLGRGWCILKAGVGRDALDGSLNKPDLKEAFHDALEAEGYDVAGGDRLLFDEEVEDDILRAEYRVGAEIVDARTDLCYRDNYSGLFGTVKRAGLTGRIHLTIRWHLYDALHRATVMTVETDGYARRRLPNVEGADLLVDTAFEMAAHNFGADASVRDLILRGIRPARRPSPQEIATAPSQDNGNMTIDPLPLSHTPLPARLDQVRKIAVLVQAGAGHGSGVLVGTDGLVVTNSHVVGKAVHVRIVLANRERALIGDVIRIDPARDVALIRLREPPSVTDSAVVPLRTDWPNVGEQVYAIGAPNITRLQDTVTSGIVSAHRRKFRMLGTVQDFIQSDVTIQGGNSGGPLLDAYGNLVGLAVAGMAGKDGNNMGLNYFIPIGEALDALGVGTGERETFR